MLIRHFHSDNQLAEAYTAKGHYYNAHGRNDKAIVLFNKAIEYEPELFVKHTDLWEAVLLTLKDRLNLSII